MHNTPKQHSHTNTRCSHCTDLWRRLWDQALRHIRYTTLGDRNCWRGSNKYSDLLTRSIYSTISTHINILTVFVVGIHVDIHSKQVDSNLLLLLSLLLLFSRLLFAIDPISKRKMMIELGIAGIRTYDLTHPRCKNWRLRPLGHRRPTIKCIYLFNVTFIFTKCILQTSSSK